MPHDTAHPQSLVAGHGLGQSRTDGTYARAALAAGGLWIAALAIAMVSIQDWRWAALSSGLFGLLACHVWCLDFPRGWLGGASGEDTRLGQREPAAARAAARLLPEGLSPSYGAAIIDRDFRIVWCNETAAAHFGIDVIRDVNRRITHVFRDPSLLDYVMAGRFGKPLRLRPPEGDGPILSVQFVPYVASGWLLLSRSLARAARLEALKRDCIANASHELRTPLTVMVCLLDSLRERQLDPHLSREDLDLMEQQCGRMQRIVTDLLQLSTLESASEPPAAARVSTERMLHQIRAEATALSAGRHRIVLEREDGYDLLGAESEIASAFGNLVSNAIRYTPAGGTVRLIWRASPAEAEFTVEDTGIGIEAKHIPRLTERFYRVNRERSHRSGGTGLGLAIVKQALARHQAALEIESEPGKGSRFTARLPAHRVTPAAG